MAVIKAERHPFPCLSISGLETLSKCHACGTFTCYIQAWKEHLHWTLGGPVDCTQCEALRKACQALREAHAADIHAATPKAVTARTVPVKPYHPAPPLNGACPATDYRDPECEC